MKRVQGGPDRQEDVIGEKPVEADLDDERNDEVWNVFPEEHVQALRGLIYLGRLEKEYEYAGHSFLMSTLTEGDILRVGQLTGKYKGTLVEIESHRAFVVAASVQSVDGISLSQPISDDWDVIGDKVRQVKEWYPAVIRYLYERYVELEATAIDVSNALKK